MVSRIRKNSKNLKRSLKKNKYIGGITSKSGLHAFFVNKAEWNKLFGEVVKDTDAPSIKNALGIKEDPLSIKNIEEKLKGKGYYIENNGMYIDLIGVNGSKGSSYEKIPFLQSACYGSTCHAALLNKKKFDTSDVYIQDVFALIHNHFLFSKIVYSDGQFSTVKNPLNIDYCVVIDVSRVQKNIFKKSVDYLQNNESDERAKDIARDDYTNACLFLKKENAQGCDNPLECQYRLRINP